MTKINKKVELEQQLKIIKSILSNDEWILFTLAYYEHLTINEISLVLNKSNYDINNSIDIILRKVVPILGDNVKLL